MDNKAVLKKKRELLYNFNKRKLSLRKTMDNLKQSECRLDISQITKCVFLGALALKPVPHLFDCPNMLADFERRLWSGDEQVPTIASDENSMVEKQIKVKNEGENTINDKSTTIKTETNKKTLNRRYSKGKRLLADKKNVKGNCLDKAERSQNKNENSNNTPEPVPVPREEPPNPKEETIILTSCIPEPSNSPQISNDQQEVSTHATTIIIDNNLNTIRRELEPELQPQPTNTGFLETLTNSIEFDDTSVPAEIIVLKQVIELPPGIHPPEGLEILPYDSDTVLTPLQPVNPYTIPTATEHQSLDILNQDISDPPSSDDDDDDMEPEIMFDLVNIKMEREVFDMQMYGNQFQQRMNQMNQMNQTTITKIETGTGDKDNLKKYGKKTPQCKICSQMFPSYRLLKKHKMQHEGEKPYLCLQCGVNQDSLEQLIAHLRTHKGEYPYVCKKCNQGFKTLNALEAHQPVHVLKKVVEPKKMFQCEVCSKEFKKLCDLERHTRVHTGEKPVVCNICNQRFQQAHNLNKHLLIHTQEKPFQCDICNKKFGRNDVLNRHLLTHAVSKPNHCAYCMKSFIRASQLIAHVEKYHGQTSNVTPV